MREAGIEHLMTYLDRLQQHMGARYSETYIQTTQNQAEKFLRATGVKAAYTREDILGYMDTLTRGGLKANSIRTMLAAVKTLLYANSLPWPLDRRDMHLGKGNDETEAPALSVDEVKTLIKAVRGMGLPEEPAVALASIWGFRTNEIAAGLTQGLDGRRLEIKIKGGKTRSHTIYPPLQDVLRFKPSPITREGMHHIFQRLMRRYVREPRSREGFHSCRRTLATELFKTAVSPYTVHRYMCWRVAEIGFTYYRATMDEVEREVLRYHPFIKFWG